MANKLRTLTKRKPLVQFSLLYVSVFLFSSLAQAQPAKPKPGAPAAPSANAATAPSEPGTSLSTFMEPFEYDPLGRKDPFQKPAIDRPLAPGSFHGPVLPLQRFALSQLTLVGIIWDVARPRAMFKDPEQRVHVIGPNAKLGNQNGYIAVIREGEVVVIETFEEDGKLYSAPRIVKLADKSSRTARK